jgi:hypothetical protein
MAEDEDWVDEMAPWLTRDEKLSAIERLEAQIPPELKKAIMAAYRKQAEEYLEQQELWNKVGRGEIKIDWANSFKRKSNG